MTQASLFSMLHCRAASARSSARRLASSYEISSSSDGPGLDSERALRAVEAAVTDAGIGLEAVVEILTCRMGATSDSAAATGALAAEAFSLASECQSGDTPKTIANSRLRVAASMVNWMALAAGLVRR